MSEVLQITSMGTTGTFLGRESQTSLQYHWVTIWFLCTVKSEGADCHLILSGYGWFLVACLFCFVFEGSMMPWILLTPFSGLQVQNVTWTSVSQVSTTAI